jgi:hypothetical protein
VDRTWVVALAVAAGFLPVLTLRTLWGRLVAAFIATNAAVCAVWLYRASVEPGIELMALTYDIFLFGAVAVLLCLFCVGLAGAATRAVGRIGKARPPGWATPLYSVLAVAVVFGVSYAVSRVQTTRVVSANDAIVAAARDSAGPQTKEELAQGVVNVLLAASDGRTEAVGFASDELLGLWHPGPLKNDEYFLKDPDFEEPYDRDNSIGLGVRNELVDQFRSSDRNGAWDSVQPGDAFAAEWSGEVPLAEIDQEYRWLLSYYDQTRWDGSTFADGVPLFPDGRYHRLDVTLVRGELKASFLTLYAVDDGGKWWLVGIDNPNWPDATE